MMYVKNSTQKSTQSVAQPPRFFWYTRNDKQFFDSHCQRATSFFELFLFRPGQSSSFLTCWRIQNYFLTISSGL